jgi:hypothetical protein
LKTKTTNQQATQSKQGGSDELTLAKGIDIIPLKEKGIGCLPNKAKSSFEIKQQKTKDVIRCGAPKAFAFEEQQQPLRSNDVLLPDLCLFSNATSKRVCLRSKQQGVRMEQKRRIQQKQDFTNLVTQLGLLPYKTIDWCYTWILSCNNVEMDYVYNLKKGDLLSYYVIKGFVVFCVGVRKNAKHSNKDVILRCGAPKAFAFEEQQKSLRSNEAMQNQHSLNEIRNYLSYD